MTKSVDTGAGKYGRASPDLKTCVGCEDCIQYHIVSNSLV